MPRLSVLVPCLNERENLGGLLTRLGPVLDAGDGEVILVDDGSDDASHDVLHALAARDTRVQIRSHARRRGIPQAWRTGLSAARGVWVASLDADLQYEPEDILRLLAHAEATGADFVQGARRRGKSEGPVRHVLSRGLNHALNITFGTSAEDHKSALFVCRREHLALLLAHRRRFHHWQCFIGVAARAFGLRCEELPVSFRPRERGTSAFGALPLRSTLEVLADFAPALWLYGRPGAR